MFKITPNPPEDDSKKLDEAAERALAFYLDPKLTKPNTSPGQLFTVVEDADMECLLANLSETLASVNAMASDLAFELDGSRRHVVLGIQQMVELSELLANRALDIAVPR
ncbi:DUF6124 family protein [Pseudomonas fluorescens]|uniref:DUF3077 domain-containing protein n=2 Tax=Pseudomonas fluorescens TaxID=294 RepID=A0A944DN42_PSEFL|nr:DUF6124 family protein [Pseudomonas fluorescens]MBT2296167.1 hypothetical protein [Pseudomonas fluorescens]MBT2296168.1 hypothetical protein [Pseudomonas fluorescens]MBT2308191.1 hypothetical protein [Pseudomonas fluorescens]MBT2313400.1 hypothetical protein [Pseudomonas fluorescens]MBT2313401.1 hypothetical protein [Pseudomonas fluorescens]